MAEFSLDNPFTLSAPGTEMAGRDMMAAFIMAQNKHLAPMVPLMLKMRQQATTQGAQQDINTMFGQALGMLREGNYQGAADFLGNTVRTTQNPLVGQAANKLSLALQERVGVASWARDFGNVMQSPEAERAGKYSEWVQRGLAQGVKGDVIAQIARKMDVAQNLPGGVVNFADPVLQMSRRTQIQPVVGPEAYRANADYLNARGIPEQLFLALANSPDPKHQEAITQIMREAPAGQAQIAAQTAATRQRAVGDVESQQLITREKALAPTRMVVAAAQGYQAALARNKAEQEQTVFERTIGQGIVYDLSTRQPLNPGATVGEVGKLFRENRLVRLTNKDAEQLTTIRGQRPLFDALAQVSEDIFKDVKPGENVYNRAKLYFQEKLGSSAMAAGLDALQANRLMLGRIIQGSAQGISNMDVATVSGLVPSKWDTEKTAKARIAIGQQLFNGIEQGLLQQKPPSISGLIQQLRDLDAEIGVTRTLDKDGNLVEEPRKPQKPMAPGEAVSPGGRRAR